MRDEPYKVIKHAGLTIEIHPDHHDQGPNEWADENLFLTGFHRDFWVERKGFDKEIVREYLETGSDDTYWVFPLEAYIHSGVVLAIKDEGNFVDRQWDVSVVGAVFCSKKEFETGEQAKDGAKGLIQTWNMSLSGEVYGFVIKTEDGEDLKGDIIDSLWGCYGLEYCISEAKEQAEWFAKNIQKKHETKLKVLIKNRVPLEKRV